MRLFLTLMGMVLSLNATAGYQILFEQGGTGGFELGEMIEPGKYEVASMSASINNCVKDLTLVYGPTVEQMESADCFFSEDQVFGLYFDSVNRVLYGNGHLNSNGHSWLFLDEDSYSLVFLSYLGALGVMGGTYQVVPEPGLALLLGVLLCCVLVFGPEGLAAQGNRRPYATSTTPG